MGIYVPGKYQQLIYVRGPNKVEDLKPVAFIKNDGIIRYDFHEIVSIVDLEMGCSQRNCELYFDENIKDLPTWMKDEGVNIEPASCWDKYREYAERDQHSMDYWHYQMDAIFRSPVRNDQVNTIYVGTESGVDKKRLKIQPNYWQLHILKIYNRLFHHLASNTGYIKVENWW